MTQNTQTLLLASVEQAEALIAELQKAIKTAKKHETTSYARVVLEQAVATGPWRLVIGVTSNGDENAQHDAQEEG